jgi:hypothetical protein
MQQWKSLKTLQLVKEGEIKELSNIVKNKFNAKHIWLFMLQGCYTKKDIL